MVEGEAVSNNISGTLGNVFSGIASGTIWAIIVLILIGLGVGLFIFIRYRKKFDIRIEVKSQRENNTFSTFYDKGAILTDSKTGDKFLRLWSSKIELPVPPYSYLIKTNEGDLIKIWRKSETEFIILGEGQIAHNKIVDQFGRLRYVPQQEYLQVEGDIAFWNTKRKQAHKDIFGKNSLLQKLMEWMPQIIGAVFTVIILYILLNSLPELLKQLTELATKLNAIQSAPGGAVVDVAQ